MQALRRATMTNPDYKNQTEFFKALGDEYIQTKTFCGLNCTVTIEEMYQHFKVRMIEELKVSGGSHSGVVYGKLENKHEYR